MSSQAIARTAVAAIIAGIIAAVIYEVIYFLTSNHHLRSGVGTAALIGVITFLIAFVIGVIFRLVFQRRS